MTKITLQNIMESLTSDDVSQAEADLHQWLVSESKKIHANLTAEPVAESEETDECEEEKVEEAVEETEEAVEEAFVAEAPAGFYAWTESSSGAQMFYGPYASEEEAAATAAKVDGRAIAASELNADEQKVLAGYQQRGFARNGFIEVDLANDEDVEAVIEILGLGDEDLYGDLEDIGEELGRTRMPHFEVGGFSGNTPNNTRGDEPFEEIAHQPTFEELVAELSESFKGLETVSDKLQNVEGAQVGEQGKVPVNTKGTLPSKKGADRIAGEPVEIKSSDHKGHALEKAPKVADVKIKNTVQNGKEELEEVPSDGDSAALLNKVDGKVNTQSPISGKGAKGLKK